MLTGKTTTSSYQKSNPPKNTTPTKPNVTEQTRHADTIKQHLESNKISDIYLKLSQGSMLHEDEFAYIRDKSPSLYQKAVEVESERRLFSTVLYNSRSTEEAQAYKMRKIMMLAGSVQRGSPMLSSGNGDIINMKLAAIDKEYQRYTQGYPQRTTAHIYDISNRDRVSISSLGYHKNNK